MATCCSLWQQKLLFSKTITFSLRTSRCKTVHSDLAFRSIPVVTLGSCILPCHANWQRNTRFSPTFPSQRGFLGYPTHLWPLVGANCVPRHLFSSLRGALLASLHTGHMTSTEEKKDTRPKSKDGEVHGSVLMEMIKSQDQQPKQLTVGARGMHACCTLCNKNSHSSAINFCHSCSCSSWKRFHLCDSYSCWLCSSWVSILVSGK